MRARLAWALFALTVFFAVAQVTLVVLSDRALVSTQNIADGFPLVTVAAVAGAGIGALIVSRYPRHRIGWLLVVGQCGTAFGVAAQAYSRAALTGELGSAPFGHLAIWLSIQTGAIFAITLLAVLFLLAPDGHLLSPRWRWMIGAGLLGLLLNWVAVATVPPSRINEDGDVVGADGPLLDPLVSIGVILAFVSVIGGTVSLVKRLRRASGQEREHPRSPTLSWLLPNARGVSSAAS